MPDTDFNSTCTMPPFTFLAEPAYAGLNGRLKQIEVEIEPWQETITTEICQNETGVGAFLKYPLENSTRTRTQVSTRFKNGYVWEIADFARDVEYLSDVEYDANGAITKIVRGNNMFLDITRDVQGRPLQYLPAAVARLHVTGRPKV